jgi:hypothetical protein
MKVQITERRISDTDPEGTRHLFHEGDVVTVSDAYGQKLCALGWAKDVDGVVPTGERRPGAQTLEVHKTVVQPGSRLGTPKRKRG